jgi:crossover junction endodeoxyribonuclease RusA
MSQKTFTKPLPYPPSVNHYWRYVNGRVLISAKGRKYRQDVCAAVFPNPGEIIMDGRLSITLHIFPPDKRRRDVDNVLKAILDSLQHANVYADDSQIDEIHVFREKTMPNGEKMVRATVERAGLFKGSILHDYFEQRDKRLERERVDGEG